VTVFFRRVLLPIAALGLLLPSPVAIPAQTNGDDTAAEAIGTEPIPYDPTEFPEWSRDLRRGEIIALGAFPVAMIVSGLGYQIGRFGYQSIRAGEVAGEYAPGFFAPSDGARYDSDERVGLIISGAVISVGIALADYLLGRREASRRENADR
jgi:hypothetical protein